MVEVIIKNIVVATIIVIRILFLIVAHIGNNSGHIYINYLDNTATMSDPDRIRPIYWI